MNIGYPTISPLKWPEMGGTDRPHPGPIPNEEAIDPQSQSWFLLVTLVGVAEEDLQQEEG